MKDGTVFSTADEEVLCLAAYYLNNMYPGYKKAKKADDIYFFERMARGVRVRIEKVKDATKLHGLIHYLELAVKAMENATSGERMESVIDYEKGRHDKSGFRKQMQNNNYIIDHSWDPIEHHYKDALAAVCSVNIGLLTENSSLVQRVCL